MYFARACCFIADHEQSVFPPWFKIKIHAPQDSNISQSVGLIKALFTFIICFDCWRLRKNAMEVCVQPLFVRLAIIVAVMKSVQLSNFAAASKNDFFVVIGTDMILTIIQIMVYIFLCNSVRQRLIFWNRLVYIIKMVRGLPLRCATLNLSSQANSFALTSHCRDDNTNFLREREAAL